MMNIHVGCAGWDYIDWIGSFYPKNLEKHSYLEYYSKHFNLVEVNSTFYNLPAEETVIKWNDRVPKTFNFIIKAWKNITHDLFNQDMQVSLSQFFNRIHPLQEKTSGILFQFPPWFKYSKKHFKRLLYLLKQLPNEYKYIIELRHNGWYDPELIGEFINGKNILLGTIYLDNIRQYYLPDQEIYYIRLIGDRKLNKFNRVQREQISILNQLFDIIKNMKRSPYIKDIFIIVNNHFSGFSPETANLIKSRLSIPYKSFNAQKKLLDYI